VVERRRETVRERSIGNERESERERYGSTHSAMRGARNMKLLQGRGLKLHHL
jgi:hypothetical protein